MYTRMLEGTGRALLLASKSAKQQAFDSATFWLPLNDLGAGVVNTNPLRGSGGPTFTRATAAATKLSTGLWKLDVASGVARSNYLGMTTASGIYGGYLIESAATQLALDVRDMTQASWVKVTMTTAQTSTGIDGVANSCTRITATGASSTILQTLVAAASSRTYSCWIKRITGTGTILIQQGVTTLDVTALINSATFTQVKLNSSTLNSAYGITIVTSGDAVDVDCNQFESGAIASSPIPAAGSRNADVLAYITNGNISATNGSVYLEYTSMRPNAAADPALLATSGGNGIPIYLRSNGFHTLFDSGAARTLNAHALPAITIQKFANAWGGVTCQGALNGIVSTATTFSGDMNIGASMTLGVNVASSELFGTIKDLRICRVPLQASILQAMTT